MPVVHFLTPQVGGGTTIDAFAVRDVFEVHFSPVPCSGLPNSWKSTCTRGEIDPSRQGHHLLIRGRGRLLSTRLGTLRLTSAATRTRQVLLLPLRSNIATGTIKLRTLSGRLVLIDGLGLRRT